MKIYISYFYNIRYMNEKLLPVAVTKTVPFWFIENIYCYDEGSIQYPVDKNGVTNGVHIEQLVMPELTFNKLPEDARCTKNCTITRKHDDKQEWCPFMNAYYSYLNTCVDFDAIMQWLTTLSTVNGVKDRDIVLIVYEPSYLKCAERPVLVQWFHEHGIEVTEWEPPIRKVEQQR